MKKSHAESSTRRPARFGLTLLELVVVMAIIAALAAIVAPLLPNLLRRAHKATDATQTSELSKAVQLYQALYYSYPDNFDLLTTAGATGAFPTYMPGANALGTTAFGGFATPGQLTADEVGALTHVGIRYVQPMATTATQPTLNPYPTGVATTDRIDLSGATAATTTMFAILNETNIQTANPLFLQSARVKDPTARFVVFGVGTRSSIVGQVIQDAPTSVPQNAGFTPANTYSRVGLVFKVSGAEVAAADNRARFVAAVALEDDELETTEKDIVGYYEVASGTGNN